MSKMESAEEFCAREDILVRVAGGGRIVDIDEVRARDNAVRLELLQEIAGEIEVLREFSPLPLAIIAALNTARLKYAGKTTQTCERCGDTHVMTLHREGHEDREVMCTSCPTPCQKCRQGGTGPYCETTPCGCECHEGDRQ